ncbi:ribonuclease domain-containing protein [Streptomyces sp. NPDC002067]
MKIRFSVRPAAVALAALLSGLLLVLTGCGPGHASSASSPGPSATRTAASRPAGTPEWADRMATVPERELPNEARRTLRLIDAGGPYPYRKDGTVFGNYEKRLPMRARGYYHEFTVPTPGARDRGARRLITGERHEIYYTADHYRSFKAVLR